MKWVNLTAMTVESWDATLPTRWRTLRSVPASGATNMAVDATLLEAGGRRDFGVWRTYAWERPTVSFGRNESARARFDPEGLAEAGLEAVRRPTGGRALLHAAEVTYSVTVPIDDRTSWQAVYEAVNSVLLAALRSLDVDATMAGPPADSPQRVAPMRPDGPVCFEQPAPGEIVVGGAKLVGSAVWRERGAYLQHGSILLEDHQPRLLAAMRVTGNVASGQLPPQTESSRLPAAAALSTCCTPVPTGIGWPTRSKRRYAPRCRSVTMESSLPSRCCSTPTHSPVTKCTSVMRPGSGADSVHSASYRAAIHLPTAPIPMPASVSSATSLVRHAPPVFTRLLLTTALALVAACGGGTDAPATGTEEGGTMVVVIPAEPHTLFPPRASGTQDLAVVASVFDRLAEIGPDLSTIGDAGFSPRLASGWDWAADSLSIAFHLDPRIRWHDGAPLRAEDVRYTFHVYTADAVASEVRGLLGNIDSVSVRDSLTAVVWFKRRTPQQFMDATYTMFILPSHLLASLPDSALVNAPFGRAPIGTGRFRFSRWDAGSRLEIVSDTSNPRGRAVLDRVIWTFVADLGAATVKLFAGEADFLERIRVENIPQVATTPSLRLETNLPLLYGFVGFNLQARRTPKSAGPPHPVLGDLRVRRALAMAVDRPRMVRSVFDSLGMVAFGPAPRVLIPDTASLRAIPYSLESAKALLDSAGWTDTNGDGVREHEGVSLAFDLLIPSTSAARVSFAQLLQAAFKEVGAKVTLVSLDPSALEPRLNSRDFDAWMGAFAPNPGLQGVRQTWVSKGESNYQSYNSPTFDALVDSALTGFDVSRTRGHWTRAFQQAIDDVPSIWLYEERIPVVVHRRIRIPSLRADGWYATLADWSVDPTQRIDRDRADLGGPR